MKTAGEAGQRRGGLSDAARLETAETKVRITERITVADEPKSVVASQRSVLLGTEEEGLSPVAAANVGSGSSLRVTTDGPKIMSKM